MAAGTWHERSCFSGLWTQLSITTCFPRLPSCRRSTGTLLGLHHCTSWSLIIHPCKSVSPIGSVSPESADSSTTLFLNPHDLIVIVFYHLIVCISCFLAGTQGSSLKRMTSKSLIKASSPSHGHHSIPKDRPPVSEATVGSGSFSCSWDPMGCRQS